MSGWGSGYSMPSVGRGWDGTGRAAGGHSVGVVEARSKAPAAVTSERFGQVVEIVSWDRDAGVGEVVIGGDTTNTPTVGKAFFGRKAEGEITGHRIQPGSYNPRTGVRSPDELILTVRSKFCPQNGARIRPYVEPRTTASRETTREWYQR